MKFLIAFLFLSMCNLGRAEVDCSNVKSMPDFQVNKVVGSWYLIEGTSHEFSNNLKCLRLNITPSGPNQLHSVIEGKTKDDSDVYATADMEWNTDEQTFEGHIDRGSTTDTIERRIETDYETYMILSHCSEKTQSVHSWVFSKTRDVDADFMDTVNKVLEKNGISEYEYFKVDQSNC